MSLNELSWAQSLFKRMNFKWRRATKSKLEIPAGAKEKAEVLFLHSIIQKIN